MEFVLGDKFMAQLAIADQENPELAAQLREVLALMRQACEGALDNDDVVAAMARAGYPMEPMMDVEDEGYE